MNKADTNAELEALLEKLKNSSKLVVVEGKKDAAALRKLGIRNIKTINKPLFAVAEDISANHAEVVLLTDLDAEGKKLFSSLNTNLQKLGVKVDYQLRNFLFRKTKLRQVEGLYNYLKKE